MNHRSASHVGTSDCAKEVNEQLSNDGRKLLSQRGESEKVGGHVEVAPNSMHAGELVVSDWYKKVYVDTGRVEDDRVRFCHQLDYATSGILVMGLSRRDAAACQQLFQERKAKKLYSAILFGHYFYQSTADDKGHENAQLPYCPRPSRGLPVSPTCDGDTTTSHAISALPTAERTAAHIFAGDNSSGPCGVEKLNDSPDAVQICTGIDYVCNLQNHCNELGRLSAPIAKQCCADVAIGTQKQRAAEETKEAGGEQHDIADDKYFFRMQAVPLESSTPGTTKVATTLLHVIRRGYIKVKGPYYGKAATRVNLIPTTGRRHQLRVHCAHLGHPIVGDATYSGDHDTYRLCLHARELFLPFESRSIPHVHIACDDDFDAFVFSDKPPPPV
eukprot:GHVQ01043120.1.p2 GENE.GHVQ01043120.1~~GHVQ01043120.1.p2  ORF type:complete len:387 (+),score=56.79 GHVQ01043120.1:1579-2739(+)